MVMHRDISGCEIRLDMWGECATRFDAETILAAGQKEPVIAIFVGTLTKIFKGQTTFSASLACRWYIDSSLPEIQTPCHSSQNSPVTHTVRRELFTVKSPAESSPNPQITQVQDLPPET